MISAFRFTDNVQCNISSYVKVNKYGDCCIYYTISYLWLKSKHKEYNLSYISSSRNEKQTFLFPYPLPLYPLLLLSLLKTLIHRFSKLKSLQPNVKDL